MKDASAEGRKKHPRCPAIGGIQKHGRMVWVLVFCHPELVSGSLFLVLNFGLKPRPVGGVLYSHLLVPIKRETGGDVK